MDSLRNYHPALRLSTGLRGTPILSGTSCWWASKPPWPPKVTTKERNSGVLTKGVPLILTDGLRDVESEVPGDGGWGVVVFDVRASFNFSWQRETGNQTLMRRQPCLGQFLVSAQRNWAVFCPEERDWFHFRPGDTYSLDKAVTLTPKSKVYS